MFCVVRKRKPEKSLTSFRALYFHGSSRNYRECQQIPYQRLRMYAEVATQLTTIAVTLVTCLPSVKAWDFWKQRLELQREDRQLEKKDKNLYVEELRSRLSILQDKFDALSMKREVELAEMNMKMQELTVSLAVTTEKVEQLQAENDSLRTMLEG